jgi:hypothetical protein
MAASFMLCCASAAQEAPIRLADFIGPQEASDVAPQEVKRAVETFVARMRDKSAPQIRLAWSCDAFTFQRNQRSKSAFQVRCPQYILIVENGEVKEWGANVPPTCHCIDYCDPHEHTFWAVSTPDGDVCLPSVDPTAPGEKSP